MLCISADYAVVQWLAGWVGRWVGVCLSVTVMYCVATAKDTAIVAKECAERIVPKLSNGATAIFNDLVRHLTQISTSRHYLTLNISETVRNTVSKQVSFNSHQ